MRILYHHRTQSEDAQGIHIYEMVKAFRDLGHEVVAAALVEVDEFNGKNVRGSFWKTVLRWAPNWLYDLMALAYNPYGCWILYKTIKSKRPDLIYERYALNALCGIWASRFFGIPLVLEVNAPLYYEQDKLGKLVFKRIARFTERWICSHSTWTVVVSKAMKEVLAQEGVPDGKMVVIPNGIDPQRFHPHVTGEAVRQRYGLEGNLVVGFVGWFRKWHGLEMLLEIMHEARLAERGVRLLLVGDGPAFPDLYRYAETHDLLSTVVFTGPLRRQEVTTHIAAMDIAVQPSAPEYACPMKIFEYMGMGKCIVAPNQPNIREILENRVTGFLCEPGNKRSLQSTLLELLADPANREAVGLEASASIFKRSFLWHANAEKILTLVYGGTVAHAGNGSDAESKPGRKASSPVLQGTP